MSERSLSPHWPAQPRVPRRAARTGLAAAGLLAALAAGGAQAQAGLPWPVQPSNVLQLSAEASLEVTQDLLSITLQVVRDGTDAQVVQTQLRQVLDAALQEARRAVRPGQLDVRTGSFTLYPRRSAQGTGAINGWQGMGEVVLEGRDMQAIGQMAGRLQGLNVTRVSYGLSREARERVHADVSADAIARFKARAQTYAQQFGFGGFAIREVNVSGGDVAPHPAQPMYRMAAASARAGDEAQPIEAGKATVTVNVSGSVQMTAR